jgi:phosphoribosylglycinamide formyltransferase-1
VSLAPVGVIVSSGGSVVATAVEVLRAAGRDPVVHVITDRACGMEAHAERLGLPWTRIQSPDRVEFSARAAQRLLHEGACAWTCLFFSRLVDAAAFAPRPCINVHPSLLPAYAGFRAVERLHADGGTVLGATAHRVDASTDGGPIVAQVAWPVPPNTPLETLQRWSFAQKLWVLLCLMHANGALPVIAPGPTDGAPWWRPPLPDEAIRAAYEERLRIEGIRAP